MPFDLKYVLVEDQQRSQHAGSRGNRQSREIPVVSRADLYIVPSQTQRAAADEGKDDRHTQDPVELQGPGIHKNSWRDPK